MSIQVRPSFDALVATIPLGRSPKPPSPLATSSSPFVVMKGNNNIKENDTPLSSYSGVDISFVSSSSSLAGSHRSTKTKLIIREEDGGGVETSRITVNTHNSILNIAEDDEDDDEHTVSYTKSFLLEDNDEEADYNNIALESESESHRGGAEDQQYVHGSTTLASCLPQTPPVCRPTWCENGGANGTNLVHKVDGSMFETLVDTLCNAENGKTPCGASNREIMVWMQYQRVLECDILELLGCSNPPDAEELARVWQFNNFANNMASCNFAATTAAGISSCQETGDVMLYCQVPKSSSSDCVGVTVDSAGCVVSAATPSKQQRRARRRLWRERVMHVHRLRTDRRTVNSSPSTVTADIFSPYPMTNRSQSMDDRLMWNAERSHKKSQSATSWTGAFHLFGSEPKDLTLSVGRGMEPILPEENEEDHGYDSDPEEQVTRPFSMAPRLSSGSDPSHMTSSPPTMGLQNYGGRLGMVLPLVDMIQETLNMTWTLTWWPGTNDSFREPRAIQTWIERGTLIEYNTVMLEPNLMWRETYQPDLITKRKLNATSQKPHSIRLLSLCRILVNAVDRDQYPLVRPCNCLLIRTSDEQEFLFEAATERERDDLVRRWKQATARFATLAVLEDLETICKEFFSPVITSKMLVPDYSKVDSDLAPEDDIDDDYHDEHHYYDDHF